MPILGKVKDQSLRPWTLDFAFDESIALECSELEKAMRRTAPFKKGGDYAYLQSNIPNDVDANGKKRSSAHSISKDRRLSDNLEEGENNYESNGDCEADDARVANLSSKRGLSIKTRLSISSIGAPQSEPNMRKPLIINVMNTPLHDYSNLHKLQIELDAIKKREDLAASQSRKGSTNQRGPLSLSSIRENFAAKLRQSTLRPSTAPSVSTSTLLPFDQEGQNERQNERNNILLIDRIPEDEDVPNDIPSDGNGDENLLYSEIDESTMNDIQDPETLQNPQNTDENYAGTERSLGPLIVSHNDGRLSPVVTNVSPYGSSPISPLGQNGQNGQSRPMTSSGFQGQNRPITPSPFCQNRPITPSGQIRPITASGQSGQSRPNTSSSPNRPVTPLGCVRPKTAIGGGSGSGSRVGTPKGQQRGGALWNTDANSNSSNSSNACSPNSSNHSNNGYSGSSHGSNGNNNGHFGSSFIQRQREGEEEEEEMEEDLAWKNRELAWKNRGSPNSRGSTPTNFSNIGDGTVLGRRRVKAMKNFVDQERTTTGFQSLSVHPDAKPDEREQIVALAAVTRAMVSGIASDNLIDSGWNLLVTPGFHQPSNVGKIYKSEMNAVHTSNKNFKKSINNMDKSLNIRIDALSRWTEKAAVNKVQIFTPGGTMKFN